MEVGLTGLGRMGAGMAERWVRGGHRVVVHNRSRGPVDELAAKGVSEFAFIMQPLKIEGGTGSTVAPVAVR